MSKCINIKSMSRENVKLFICNHPAGISLYKNLIEMIRVYDQKAKIIFVKINHPYFKNFNFKIYEKYFDHIIELKFISYKKNLILGFWDVIKYKNRVKKKIYRLLDQYKKVDIFLSNSAWLPVNVLQSMLARRKNILSITRFSGGDLESPETKSKKIKDLFCNIYSICFRCRKVKLLYSPQEQFLDFKYIRDVPGMNIKVVNPLEYNNQIKDLKGGVRIMPFPRKIQRIKKGKRNMVIVFGDESIYRYYREYLPDYATYLEKLNRLFQKIKEKYNGCQLYYKPHPTDKGKIMPGVDLNIFKLFNDEYDASGLFDIYSGGIKAVYSFVSTCSSIGSMYGIPSYRFYKYFCVKIPAAIIEHQYPNLKKNPFLFDICSLDQIGIIDNAELVNNTKVDIKQLWRPFLNV